MGSQLLTSGESETAGNCEREVVDDQDFLLAAVVGLCWNCALDLCFLRHTITRSSHYYFSFLLPLSLWSLCLKYWDRDFWTKIHSRKATMHIVYIHTLGITITEMQKLFCHKIENVSISRFLCVILLRRKAFCAIFYACMPA